MTRVFTAVCALLMFTSVVADQPGYNYIGVEYLRTDIDDYSHFDAFSVGFSEDIRWAEDFHIFITISEGKLENSSYSIEIDSSTYLLGGGKKVRINDRNILHFNLGYARTTADLKTRRNFGGFSRRNYDETNNSTLGQISIRSMVRDSLELGACINTDNLRDGFDIGSVSFHIEQALSKNFGLNFNTSVSADGDKDVSLALGLRYYWGR